MAGTSRPRCARILGAGEAILPERVEPVRERMAAVSRRVGREARRAGRPTPGVLAAILVGGFAWYQCSRPPARMVALVAVLAALAVAGRLVFTPIPNVVATTDIVLITGFAVGAAPGFAVGALAAAISNPWLGQGAVDAVGDGGAGHGGPRRRGAGRGTGRRIGRFGLAIACGPPASPTARSSTTR